MAENESEDRRRAVLLLVLPSVLALIAVLALIGAFLGLFGEPVDEDTDLATSSSASEAAAADADSSTSRVPQPGLPESDSTQAADHRRMDPVRARRARRWSGSSSDDGSDSGAGSGVGQGGTARGHGRCPSYVLNQTTRQGLAAAVAEDIESAGWSVTKVSWWRGRVPSTTVYYPAGYESAAEALSDAFPAIDRMRPRVAPMPDDALTVILCKEYPEV